MLIDALQKQFPQMSALRIREIVINKIAKKINCVLSYPEYDRLDLSVKDEVSDFVKKNVPENFNCTISFVNDYFTKDTFLSFIFKLIHEKFAALSVVPKENILVSEISERSFKVHFVLTTLQKILLQECNFVAEFKRILAEYSCYTAVFEVSHRDNDKNATNLLTMRDEQLLRKHKLDYLRPKRSFSAIDRIKYIGRLVDGEPQYIADITDNRDSVTVCGKIVSKSKTVSKNDPMLQICKFTLNDESGSIEVVFFVHFKVEDANALSTVLKNSENAAKSAKRNKSLNEKTAKQYATLYEGDEVLVRGRAAFSKYSNKYEIQGYDLSKCRIVSSNFEKPPKAIAPKEYYEIFPQAIVSAEQLTFDGISQQSFQHKLKSDIVVCSLCATGYNVYKDKILAVSMTKIANGVVSSVLNAVLNADAKISSDVLICFGLEDQNTLSCPTIFEVISDLYKFSYGCQLVGDEIEKTANLLRYYGEPQGFYFDNSTKNLVDLFEELHNQTGIAKRPKFNILAEVAKALRVQNNETSKVLCFEHSKLAARCIEKLLSLVKTTPDEIFY